jgi:hypothetical protein
MKLTLVWNCLFSLLSFVGALLVHRTRNEYAPLFTSLMLVFPVVFYITHTNGRYRYPMDPIMGVLTVFAIAYPLSLIAKRAPAADRPVESAVEVG